MDIELRLEQPEDYRETENLTREAFWNQYCPGCSEHYLLHIMRDSPGFVPELDVVAVHDGRVVGNAVFMKAFVEADEGDGYEVLTLGPISVLPAFQGRGIGARLIEHARSLAAGLGYRAILLMGDPAYYARCGFVPAESKGIRTEEGNYADALQVFELYEGALDGKSGRYFEDGIYGVDEDAAAAFDKGFPEKELVAGTPSQKRFEELVAMQRSAAGGGGPYVES